jgi:glycosyltransferase involved in cell wall biosynthesis
LKSRINTPIVSIVHHLQVSEQTSRYFLPLMRTIEKMYLQSIDRFIFNSNTTRAEVSNLMGAEPVGLVAYPGKDLLTTGMLHNEIAFRCKRLHPVRIIFAGNLIPRKGLIFAVQALAKVKDLSWTFEIIGDPETDTSYTSHLRNTVNNLGLADRVLFHGRLEPAALFEHFQRSQVLLSPAQYEGFGITYVEAMSCGLPVIALNIGAAPEVIADGITGMLVLPGDVEGLAGCIRRIITDQELLEKMSMAARERFNQFPTWSESMESIRSYLLREVYK